MTQIELDDLKRKIGVMTAYANGEPIQIREPGIYPEWVNCVKPQWNWIAQDYRVAPKPTYKPFNDKYEFAQALHKNSSMPYVCLNGEYRIVSQIYDEGITIAESNYTYEGLVKKNIKFLNGTVCGIPV